MTSIEALADKDAIRELLATYCFHLDNEAFEAMAALFTPDGVWETAFGTGTGRAGIVAQARSIASGGAPGGASGGASGGERPRRVHLTTNIVIELRGDSATVQSNWLLFQNSPAEAAPDARRGPVIGSGGAYHDTVVRQDGTWLFRHRRIDRYVK